MHCLLVVTLAAVPAFAQSASPAGLWKTVDDATKQEKSLIRIQESGGVFTGTLVKLLGPGASTDARCTRCSDARKDQPIVGLTLITGVTRDAEGVWAGGEILDPGNGKTYRVRLTLDDGGKELRVRGYLGVPLLGRTQTWIRVE